MILIVLTFLTKELPRNYQGTTKALPWKYQGTTMELQRNPKEVPKNQQHTKHQGTTRASSLSSEISGRDLAEYVKAAKVDVRQRDAAKEHTRM